MRCFAPQMPFNYNRKKCLNKLLNQTHRGTFSAALYSLDIVHTLFLLFFLADKDQGNNWKTKILLWNNIISCHALFRSSSFSFAIFWQHLPITYTITFLTESWFLSLVVFSNSESCGHNGRQLESLK